MRGILAMLTALALAVCVKPAGAGNAYAVATAPDRAEVFAQGLADLSAIEGRVRANPDSLGPRLDRLRVLFVLGVKEQEYLDEAAKAVGRLEERGDLTAETSNLARAYRGAVRVVRAKHGFSPGRKMEHLKAGLPALDSAVASAPDQTEVRYLRLVSGYYLPFFIGRKDEVKADFAALARLLPHKAGEFPARWYLSVAGFVLDKGRVGKVREAELRKSMQAAQAALAAEADAKVGKGGKTANAGNAGNAGKAAKNANAANTVQAAQGEEASVGTLREAEGK